VSKRPLLLLAVAALAAAAPAQQPTLPPARAELVQLDVVVTDAQGELVTDLAAEDFEVLEEGKAQRLSHFTKVGRGASSKRPDPAAPVEVTPPPEAPAAPPPPRHVVVVVDDLHISPFGIERTKDALRRFVDDVTPAGDQVALVTTAAPPVIEQLTTDRAVLRAAIARLTARQASVGAR
jgi:VWFA-related protein